jgi:hypothetical protein
VLLSKKIENMFIAALAIIAKNCEQSKCLSTDEWIKCGISMYWNIIQL